MRGGGFVCGVNNDFRMKFCEPLDHRRHQPMQCWFVASDPDIACSGSRQEFDFAQRLLECIEGLRSAFEQDIPVDRRHHSLRAAVEQADADGFLKVDSGATLNAAGVRGFNRVTVNGALNIAAAAAAPNTTRELAIGTAGVFDINDGKLIVDYIDGDTSNAVRNQVAGNIRTAANLDAGWWDGPGLTSSAARDDGMSVTALGMVDNQNTLLGYRDEFGGEAVDYSSVLVRYTYWGDIDLNGLVDSNDFDWLLYGYFFPELPEDNGWWTGDLNWDGVVDADDFDWLLHGYYFQGDPMSGSGLPAGSPMSATPEPATLALLGLGALAAMASRRRRG